MRPSKRLDPIFKITKRRHEEREIRLANQLNAQKTAENQMNVLVKFRNEYSSNLLCEHALHVSQLNNHRGFVHQINNAIEQQKERILELTAKTRQEQAAWKESLNKRDSLEKLINKRRDAETACELRKEQALTDDLAIRLRFSRF